MFQAALSRSLSLLFAAAVPFAAIPVYASTLTVSGTSAVTIFQNWPTISYVNTLEVENDGSNPTVVADSLLKFDLSSLAGDTITGNGTMTLYVAYDALSSPSFTPTIEIDSLTTAYNPNTANWNTFALVAGQSYATPALANPSLTIPKCNPSCTPIPVTFTIPQATLQSWVTSPASNYGIAVRETTSGTSGANIQFASSGQYGPVLSVTYTTGATGQQETSAPDPSTVTLTAVGIAAICLSRLRRPS